MCTNEVSRSLARSEMNLCMIKLQAHQCRRSETVKLASARGRRAASPGALGGDVVAERVLVHPSLAVEAVRPAGLARARHRRPPPVLHAEVVAADGDHLLVVALHERGVQLGRLAPVEEPARRPAAVL